VLVSTTVLGFGLLLSWFVYSGFRHLDDGVVRAAFRKSAAGHQWRIQSSVESCVQSLRSVAAFYHASQEVDPIEFKAFVTPILAAHPEIGSIAWVPEPDGLGLGVPTSEWQTTGPVEPPSFAAGAFFQPSSGTHFTTRVDPREDPLLSSAMARALTTGAYQTTPTRCPKAGAQGRCLVAFVEALSTYVGPARGEAGVGGAASGYLIMTVYVNELIDSALSQSENKHVNIRIVDTTDPVEASLLYGRGTLRSPRVNRWTRDDTPALAAIESYTVGDRNWRMEFSAAPAFRAAHSNAMYPAVILAGGLMLSFFVAVLVGSLLERGEKVRTLVAKRTEALTASKSDQWAATMQLREPAALQEANRDTTNVTFLSTGAEEAVRTSNRGAEQPPGCSPEETVGNCLPGRSGCDAAYLIEGTSAQGGAANESPSPVEAEADASDEFASTAERAAPAESDSDTAFDLDRLLKCWGNKRAFVEELIRKFQQRISGELEQLEHYTAMRDIAQVEFHAHRLRVSAGNVAAGHIRRIAAEMETAARAGDFERMESCLRSLRAEATRCLAFATSAGESVTTEPLST
jgi:HPt (histidine-containing phosphotransfer) domain-containing protein